ncbi:unnamed protein product [Sphagnum balticum]
MSACDNGTCKYCPRCGCRATCTCNRSLGFEGAINMKSFAMETGKCGNNCSPSCPNAASSSSSATDVNVDFFFFFAVVAGGTGKCGCNPNGCTCDRAKEDFGNCSEFSDKA